MSHIDLIEIVLDSSIFVVVCLVVLIGGVLLTWGVKGQPEPPQDSAAVGESYLHRQERGIED
jgi:hypothetical protein